MAKKKVKTPKKTAKITKIKAYFAGERITSNSKAAFDLYSQSRFGEPVDGKISYSLAEASYLLEKAKMEVILGNKKLKADAFLEEVQKREPNFYTRFRVYKDLRNRGYIVKTALKFGADFRVYEKGFKPGEEHAKWIVYPVYETGSMTWHEFAAKNRVAHSTKKNLLIAIVDDEGDVTYYEIKWLRP
jgi:tRNA-intron endonuclease